MRDSFKIKNCLVLVARIFAGLLAGLVLLIIVGEGPPNPFKQSVSVMLELFAVIVMLIGCLLGWKWPGLGGLLIIGGTIVFHIFEKSLLLSGALPLFDLAGILYLLSWFLKMMQKTETQTEFLKEF